MAISRQQSPITAKNNNGSAVTTGSFTSVSGTMIVVYAWLYATDATGTFGTAAVSDNKGNSANYVRRQLQFTNYTGGGDDRIVCAIFECQNITGGSGHTVTVTPSGAFTGLMVGVVPYSDAMTSNAQDQGTTSTGDSTAPASGTTSTTSQADELFCAVCTTSAGSSVTWSRNQSGSTPSSGWSLVMTESDNVNYGAGDSVDLIASGTAAADHFWSTGSDSGAWCGAIETYKAGAAPEAVLEQTHYRFRTDAGGLGELP